MNDDADNDNDEQILPQYLSDEAVAAMVELLYQIAQSLENRYFAQIRRHYQTRDPRQADLWD